jgi:hypothetical protein
MISVSISRTPVTTSAGRDAIDATSSLPRWFQKYSERPSRDHRGGDASPCETARRSPPSGNRCTYSSFVPVSSDTYATSVPSGDGVGADSAAGVATNT